jgi:hypothetical protein
LIISLPNLLLYVPNDDHNHIWHVFFFVTAFPDDCCGPIFFGRRRTVLTLVVNGHEVCLCAFDSSMAIEGIAYDAGISEPVDPPFRPKKGMKHVWTPGKSLKLWGQLEYLHIFFVAFFHLLLALGVKNRWVFKISVPTFFCCWTFPW